MITPSPFVPLLDRIELTLAKHGRLAVRPGWAASFNVDREGFTARVMVVLKKSRRRPFQIHESGATAEEAAEKLIASLDTWAHIIAS